MLKSLPVADPVSLFRIGDGSDCCVEGSPQDQWGLFSYPLFKKLRDQAPEFEQVTAFQAGSEPHGGAARGRRRPRAGRSSSST